MIGLDAEQGSLAAATQSWIGSGCVASGRTTPMTLGLDYWDSGGILGLNHQVAAGPSNAPTLIAIGASNPNLQIPGLCSPLYTDLVRRTWYSQSTGHGRQKELR